MSVRCWPLVLVGDYEDDIHKVLFSVSLNRKDEHYKSNYTIASTYTNQWIVGDISFYKILGPIGW